MTMPHDKQILPVLALRTIVPFPGQMLPLEVGRGKSLRAVNAAQQDDKRLLLVPQFDAGVTDPGARDLLDVGVVAEISQVMQHGAGHVTAVVRTLERVRIAHWIEGLPYLATQVEPFGELTAGDDPELRRLIDKVREDLTQVLAHQARDAAGEDGPEVIEVDDPDDLVHMAIAHIELAREEALLLLAEPDPEARLRKVQPVLHRLREVLRIGADIRTELETDISSDQRTEVLRQRMKSIQEELGEEADADVDALAARIAKAELSAEARTAAEKELSRLRYTQAGTPQFDVGRNYVEWLLDLPWLTSTEDRHDLAAARAILDADHAGLDKVKRRIIEFLAVRKLAPDKHGPILCLVGPPGVGKTSLGRSIAASLGRKYVRQALGGVRDEAEVRGHRRTYIGALPGRIVAGLKKAGANNPVFVLDEVDKLSSDFRGDPTSALLEVLDPEQNRDFTDHYLEVPFDLSKVMFLCTANSLETIPLPLLDRMEIIEVPSYTVDEKKEIARTHLLPKQLAEHGLEKDALVLADDALDALVSRYTREAGVRNLEREIAAVCRGVAVGVAGGAAGVRTITAADLGEMLGPPRWSVEEAARV
ncbi:MAG TPA: LON peptidase substrate-binding domain-containing protein, partial [Kofleriaceae bacterium]|nr:LON peptidase substrate-binding domain-containing protein [Kofleriaceae bacterium]